MMVLRVGGPEPRYQHSRREPGPFESGSKPAGTGTEWTTGGPGSLRHSGTGRAGPGPGPVARRAFLVHAGSP